MSMRTRAVRVVLTGVTVGLALLGRRSVLAAETLTSVQPAPSAELSEQQKIVHLLNRLGFGPRPGDVERVRKIGIDAYVQQQLHPETIDDPTVERALEPLDTLKMGSNRLLEDYWAGVRQFIARQKAEGNAEDMKLRYGIDASNMRPATPATQPEGEKGGGAMQPGGMGAPATASLRCVGELQQAKLIRAVLSERQLEEVLVDFWGNHFNIDIKKGLCRPLKGEDDRDVIRPHIFGKFRDLLEASAKSPAMIHYLDNQENSVVRERSDFEKKAASYFISQKLGMQAKGILSDKEGPNENYGREIMELHTLGVDAGYTQKDVQEVARCFTGWAINFADGSFQFQAHRHDDGEKTVLGHVIAAGGGMKDGERALDILASHPATAHFISKELCQRFVSDDPPADLVDRTAKVFTDTQGDLRKVVESIVTSPEFFSPGAYRSKIKGPFEFAVSAVRAGDGEFVPMGPLAGKVLAIREGAGTIGYGGEKLSASQHKSLNWSVYDMGQPLFSFAAPTGYPEVSSKWVSPGALIERLNFAMALTGQNVVDVRLQPQKLLLGVDADQPSAVLDRLSQQLLNGEMTPSTRQVLQKNALPLEGEGKTVNVAKLTALILGSPEFQRK
jgi:uncharacterized protein (DUF1800 family)